MAETVTRAVFEAEERGVAATAGALNQLTGAASGSAKAVDTFGKTSQTAAQEIRGVEQRVDAMQKRLAGAPAAWARYESAMRTANAAQEAGTLTGERYAATVRQIQNELSRVVAPRLDMDAANSGLSTLLGNSQKVSAAQREMAKEQLVIAQARKVADAEAARGQALLMEQAQRLRMELDPLAAAQARLNVEVAEYQSLAARGAITSDELSKATALANDRYQVQAVRLGAVAEAAKLTQNQMLNLGRQANDVGTMALMGMSPFMIFASQAGQIFGALEENSRGVSGSLQAIGSSITNFARGIPTAAYAVAGLTAAVGALYYLTKGPEARAAEESTKSFEDAVRSLEAAWKGAGTAAEEYHRQAQQRRASDPSNAMLDTQEELRRLRQDYQARVRELNFNPALSERIVMPNYGGMTQARLEIRELYSDLLEGRVGAKEMADAMRDIRMDPNNDDYTRQFAEQIRNALGLAVDLQIQIDGINAGVASIGREGRLVAGAVHDIRARFGDYGNMLGRMDPEGMDAIRAGLKAQTDELTQSTKAADDYARSLRDMRSGWNDSLVDLRRQADMFGQSEGAIAAARFEYEALAEARRLAADADQTFNENGADAARIREVASELGLLTDRVHGLREAEQERERALREAEQRRQQISDTLAGLELEGSLIGLPEVEQQVARQLHQLKLSHADLDGQRIAGQMRYNASLEETQERLEKQRQLVENVASTFLDIFTDTSSDSFFDRILKGLADISRQFADLGKQRLLDMLTGGTVGYTSGFPAPGQRTVAPIGVPLAANQNSPAGISVGAVSALNDNLRQSSRSAMDVAKQFDGLNERADSRVLDSFMQASGTWRNLSARDTAWCAAFANAALVESGQRGTGSNLASSFMNWGQGTNAPKPGDIVVLRPQASGASGHVGFFDGFDDRGNVRVFGGNQSNAANTRTFGQDQVRAFRTATRDGYVDAVRYIASGQSSVLSSGPTMSGAALQAMAGGWGGFGPVPGQGNAQLGMMGRFGQFMQSPLGQMGMMGIGSFAGGMQSGSAVSGGFGGALSGFAAGGPVGAVVGGVGGLVGGLFGRSRRKKEEERQRAAQAEAAWNQVAPNFETMRAGWRGDDLVKSGLRSAFDTSEMQFRQLQQTAAAAWKTSPHLAAEFEEAYIERYHFNERSRANFRGGFSSSVSSLNEGQGLDAPFIRARDEMAEAGKAMLLFVDDTRVAFGDGADEVAVAASAAAEQLRAMVSGPTELSEVAASVEALRGGASQLGSELLRLGVSLDDATRAVDETVGVVMDQMRGEFVQGLEDSLHELTGAGHIVDFRQSIAEFDTMFADAALLGVDAARVHEVYTLQMQAMVNQAELTGGEFEHLLTVFPQLRGVVTEFSEAAEAAVERTASQLSALRLSYDDRVFEAGIDTSTEAGSLLRFDRYAAREREEEMKAGGEAILELERALAAERNQIIKQFADRAAEETKRAMESAQAFLDGFARDIGSYLDDLRAGPDSPLTGQARVDEARKQFEEQLALARGGDRDALGSITSYADRLLEADRAYNTSSPAAQATFDEVTRALEGLPKQLKAEDIVAAEIAKAAKDLQETIRQTTLDLADRISSDFTKFDANFDGFLTIDELRPHFAGTELELQRIFSEIDLNGDGQISRLESLLASDGLTRSTLQSAFLLGPSATAGALAPHFDRLDTSLDGLLDFDEMRVALGGIATDAQIRALMAEMDLNADLHVSRLEMLLAAEGVTRSALTSALAIGPDATAKLTAGALANHFTMLDRSVNGLLDFNEMKLALGGIATDAQIRQMMITLDANGDGQISRLELLNATQRNQGVTLAEQERIARGTYQQAVWDQQVQERIRSSTEKQELLLNMQLSMLERIRANLAEANGRYGLRQFAMGGISSVPAIFGEAGPEAAVPLPDGRTIPVTLSTPRMPTMPQANDNGAMRAELQGLRSDVARLEKALVAATLAAGENVRDGVDDVADETRRANRTAERQARK